MRHIIINNIRKLILTIAILEIAVALLTGTKLLQGSLLSSGHSRAGVEILLLDLGLIIDALLMAANSNERISRIRFLAHGLLTPVLFPISADLAGLGSGPSTLGHLAYGTIWVLTAVLMVLGIWMGLSLNLKPVSIGNLNRYTQSKENRKLFQILSFILTAGLLFPLIISGIFVLISQGSVLVLLAAICMFAFTAIAPATGNADLLFVTSMIGELLMVVCMVLFI